MQAHRLATALILAAASPYVGGASARPRVAFASAIPSPNRNYRIVFDLSPASAGAGVDPGLTAIAALAQTYDRLGVTPAHRRFVVVLHAGATELALRDDAFAARHGGLENASAPLMAKLSAEGVRFLVSGQSMSLRGVSLADLNAIVTVVPTGNLAFIDLESRGYVWSSTRSLDTE